mgnify:CR=1 FL=1
MIDRIFVEAKLSNVKTYLKELEDVLIYSDHEIMKDFMKLRALERIFQLIVDEIIDINNHIVRYAKLEIPEDFQSSFLVLAKNKILPGEFAKKIAPVVGLRNRLVHRYEKVDVRILLGAVRKNRTDFNKYIKHILRFLKVPL